MIILSLPLKDIFVTQPFGYNWVDFYYKLGMLGHNGLDFKAKDGCPTYATHSGKAFNVDDKPGLGVKIYDYENGFRTLHYHLKSSVIKDGQDVHVGQLIGYCDNTGLMTTGSHLHYDLKLIDKDGNTLNYDNGYRGAIDPSPYFEMTYNGVRISNKDWDKSRSYHRYYRGRPNGGLWIEKYRVVPALTLYLKRIPSNEEINMATYGGWDRESIKNEGMWEITSQLKKIEYLNGEKPFN